MKKLSLVLCSIIMTGLPVYSQAQLNNIPVIPVKDFFRNPEKSSYKLSPDGKYLSYMAPWQKRLNINIQKIGENKALRITNATTRDIDTYFWKGNNRLIYLQDTSGDENFKLYGVDKNGKNKKNLTPFDKVRVIIVDDLEDNET